MKKMLCFVLVILILIPSNLLAVDLYKYPLFNSKIPLDEKTGGNCSHFAEECFYQSTGIKLNLTDNKYTTWLELEHKLFVSEDGSMYRIKFSSTPSINSLILMPGHIAFIEDIDEDGFVYTLESGTFKNDIIEDVIKYGDSWYLRWGYDTTEFDDEPVIYISVEKFDWWDWFHQNKY